MKAIIHALPSAWLEERRRLGQERYDAMWEGVLHMNPVHAIPHQDLRDDLLDALRGIASQLQIQGKWRTERNLAKSGGWPDDYRIPDLVYLGPETASLAKRSHHEGPPEIVLEVAGQDDQSRDKLGWYAELGVPEVWVIQVGSRQIEILLLSSQTYLKQKPDHRGWFGSENFPVELRAGRHRRKRVIELRIAGESRSHARICTRASPHFKLAAPAS